MSVALKEKPTRTQKEGFMKKTKPSSTNRVHVSYPNSMKTRLDEIKMETEKNSLSEVFRQALLFYTLAFEEHKKGSDFLIRNKDGEVERLRMFM